MKTRPALAARRRWLATIAGTVAATGPGWAAAAAPRIEWPELAWIGSERPSRADLEGVPIIVVFWATHCAFCKRHNAHIDRLFRAADPRRLRIIGVAVDSDAEGVGRYMHNNGYRFPVALDAADLRAQITHRRVVPMTCTVDRDGRLGMCIPGEMAAEDVLALQALAMPAPR